MARQFTIVKLMACPQKWRSASSFRRFQYTLSSGQITVRSQIALQGRPQQCNTVGEFSPTASEISAKLRKQRASRAMKRNSRRPLFAKAGNFAESPHTLSERVAKGDTLGIFNFVSFYHFSGTLVGANNGHFRSAFIVCSITT